LGRADSILITLPNYTVLIDTGEDIHGEIILAHLHEHNITTINYLIITHFDRDHVGGAFYIIDNIPVTNIILPNYSRESRHVASLQRAMTEAQLEPHTLTEMLRFTLEYAEFIIDPAQIPYFNFGSGGEDMGDDDEQAPRANNFSIVVRMTYGNHNFLLTGDAQSARMREILDNPYLSGTPIDVLKVPRHGRYMSRSAQFLEQLAPRYAIITDSYDDPADPRLLALLSDADIFFAQQHNVRVVSDGIDLFTEYAN